MNMVEKVARALSIADGMHPEAVSNDEDETPAWKLYVVSARAAIEAMREPTEAMMDAGEKYIRTGRFVELRWRAMIDEALVDISYTT